MPGSATDLLKNGRHLHRGQSSFASLVVRPFGRTGHRLFLSQRREHAEGHWDAGICADGHDAARNGRGDVFEMHRLALDETPETDHGVIAARSGQTPRGQRDLECPWYTNDGYVGVVDAG